MKTENDIDILEKLMTQLGGLHKEISVFAKKSPNDGINQFKLNIANQTLLAAMFRSTASRNLIAMTCRRIAT